jgi:hypothetical protein
LSKAAALLLAASAMLIAQLARAAPPEHSTHAPKMPTDRSLAEAVAVEPGATCLDHATLVEHLGSWRDDLRVDLRVSVRVRGSTSDPRSLEFSVVVRDEIVAERRFDPAPSGCADLHAVVALAIAIALDDTLASELGIIEAGDPLAPVDQVEPGDGDLPSDRDRPTPTTRRRGPALAVTAAAGVFGGLTPKLSAGGLLSFDIRPRDHFDVRIGGLATHLPSFALDAGEVAVTLAAGRVDLCWGTQPIAVRLRVCGGVAGGAAVSRASGFASNFRRTTPWFAGLAGIDIAVHLIGPLALDLGVEAVFPFQRTRLDIRSDEGQLLASERFPVAGLLVAVGPRFEF